jgi:hypothetical protein
MKKKLRLFTAIAIFNLLNSSLSSASNILDQMETYAIHIVNETYPYGLPKCTTAHINALQTNLVNISIPLELQEFWLRFGHVCFPARNIITPHIDEREYMNFIKTARELGVPSGWLPLHSGELNYFCIHPETGKVRYWTFNNSAFSENPNDQWNSFFEWIAEDWLPLIER